MVIHTAGYPRRWRRPFAKSPWQYVLDLRLQEAGRLLRTEPHLSVGQVAYACGSPDQRYFVTLFKRQAGGSPIAFRQRSWPMG